MIIPNRWPEIDAVSFTLGSRKGEIVLSSNSPNPYRLKMLVTLSNTAIPDANFFINDIQGTSIFLGQVGQSIKDRADLSSYSSGLPTVKVAAQDKILIDPEEIDQLTFESGPVNGRRVFQVDDRGIPIDSVVGLDGKTRLAVDAEVNVEVNSVQLFTKPFDAITATYPSSTQEVYTSRVGGIAGTIQETVTLNYVDATKNLLLNVART